MAWFRRSSGSLRRRRPATRVVTNRRHVRVRAIIGRVCTLGGFAALIGGLIYSTVGLSTQEMQSITVSYAALILGYILISAGKNFWLRYSLHPRPDESLAINLKTMDVRTVLFNYVSALPVDHLIMTPTALAVVETRPFIGDIVVTGDKWRRKRGLFGWLQILSEGPLGNPTRDAERGVVLVKKFLADRLDAAAAESIPVIPVVIFTHPRVNLEINEPTISVIHARDARNEIKRVTSAARMPPELVRRVETLLLGESSIDGEPVTASAAVDKRAKRRKTSRTR